MKRREKWRRIERVWGGQYPSRILKIHQQTVATKTGDIATQSWMCRRDGNIKPDPVKVFARVGTVQRKAKIDPFFKRRSEPRERTVCEEGKAPSKRCRLVAAVEEIGDKTDITIDGNSIPMADAGSGLEQFECRPWIDPGDDINLRPAVPTRLDGEG
ncbi:hypothetical protein D3C77_455260 [compost metagenome]